jgi:uncharacterized membrane protein
MMARMAETNPELFKRMYALSQAMLPEPVQAFYQLGALAGMLTPGTSMWNMAAKAGAWLGLGGRMHDAGFEDNQLRTVALQLPPNSSALIALITHQWTDDLVRFLDQTASKVGWVMVTEAMSNALDKARAAST